MLAQRAGVPEVVGACWPRAASPRTRRPTSWRPRCARCCPTRRCCGHGRRRRPPGPRRAAGETVAVFGDYDVDGACSAALVTLFLRGLGCPVLTHVPDRITEGYGPNAPALRALAAAGRHAGRVRGLRHRGGRAAGRARRAGGRAGAGPPQGGGPAAAGAGHGEPEPAGRPSGLRGLCAAGVAFLAAVATVRALRRAGWFAARAEPDLRTLLDLVALATVCDVMPLVGVNRALVAQGLKVMGRRARPGMAALLEVAAARDCRDGRHARLGARPAHQRGRPHRRGRSRPAPAADRGPGGRARAGDPAGRGQPPAAGAGGRGAGRRPRRRPRAGRRGPRRCCWCTAPAGIRAWSASSPAASSSGRTALPWPARSRTAW